MSLGGLAATSTPSPGPGRALDYAIPAYFEPLVADSGSLQFMARGLDRRIHASRHGIAVELKSASGARTSIGLRFPAGSPVSVSGEERLEGYSNYLSGPPENWRTGVPHFSRIRYRSLWRGVDAVLYENQRRLEYDFVLAPGTDPSTVRIAVEGASALKRTPDGSLLIRAGDAELIQPRPVAYQLIAGERRVVSAEYRLRGREFGFHIGPYDSRLPLVIDPVLDYSALLGGSSFDQALAVAVDEQGNAYLAGTTDSDGFPTTFGSAQSGRAGARDAFVVKLDSTGSRVLFSTFLGGSNDDSALGVAVASDRSVYVAGVTASAGFPTNPGSVQPRYGGGDNDCFLSRLAPDGRSLLFSTFFGEQGAEGCTAVTVGPDNSAYVVGETTSSRFPVTPGVFQNRFQGGERDAFVARFTPEGDVIFSTFLGGNNRDAAYGVAVHGSRVCIAGYTGSNNFPLSSDAFITSYRGGSRDAFLAILNPLGRTLSYSTYFGGSGSETANAAAFDDMGTCYITGETDSASFAIFGRATQQAYGGGAKDAFAAAVDRNNTVVYSTFLGGEGADIGIGLAVDPTGNAVITGSTTSDRFPVTPGAIRGTRPGGRDVFVSTLSPDGATLLDSTYLGAGGDDQGRAVAIDIGGRIYVAGETRSSDFPRTNFSYRGDSDAFVLRLRDTVLIRTGILVSAASYVRETIAPGSIAALFSVDLSSQVLQVETLPLPATLGGLRITIRDSAGFAFTAPLFSVAPDQANFLVPATAALGPAEARIERNGTLIATSNFVITATAPGLFTANASGEGPPAANVVTAEAGQQRRYFAFQGTVPGSLFPNPIDLGGAGAQTVLELFGTGFPANAQVTANVGGTSVPVLSAGPQGAFAGLDQVNIALPQTLAGRGLVELQLEVNGILTNRVTLLIR